MKNRIIISMLVGMVAFAPLGMAADGILGGCCCSPTAALDSAYRPKKGDWSIGVSFNPVSLQYKNKLQPKNGDFSGDFIEGLASTPKQMFILAQDPIAAFRIRYVMNENWLLRFTLGLNGSHINYREYVDDDLARAIEPDSRNQVVDGVVSDLNGGSLAVGMQYLAGKGHFRFTAGFGLIYAIAGGKLDFSYGNVMTTENRIPSSMPMTKPPVSVDDVTLNDFKADLGISYARPVERYNVGYNHGIGLNGSMGVEWFVTGRMSLGAEMTFTPLMFVFQPQTYSKFEGYSAKTGQIETYTDLVSPGSHALLYGTETVGANFSLNYYF